MNHEGRIILKRTGVQSGATQYYFYGPQGEVIGQAGDLPPDFDKNGRPKYVNFTMNDLPISENWPPAMGVDSYQALFSDPQSFVDLSANVCVDKSFAALLAFNAGYDASDNVPAEMQVPLLLMQATINRNWQGDYPNYDAQKIIGALYPKIPMPQFVPPKMHHNMWGDVFAIAFAIAIAIAAPGIGEALDGFLFVGLAGMEAVAAGVAVTVAVGTAAAAVSDFGSQEIERLAGNQKGFSTHELDKAIEAGAIASLASGLSGAGYTAQTAAQIGLKAVETGVRVAIVQAALKEAIEGGRMDWRGLALNIANATISAGMNEAIGGNGLASNVLSNTASSVMENLVSDALYKQAPDWRNVAANALGTALGTAVGSDVAQTMHQHRIDALKKASEQAEKVNQALADQQAALDQNGQVLGHELDALGSVPDTSTPQTNPYGNPLGTGIFGPPQNLQTRAANQPYGSTVNTPTADVAQPNAAQQKNNQTTARILAQQNAERAQRENIFERGWHDMERGLSSAGHDLEAHWEADKAFMEFELSPGKREVATLSNAFAAEISDPGAQRTAAEALLFGTDGMDDNFGPELATSGNSFGNNFANPLRQPLWKSNPSLMFREGNDSENESVNAPKTAGKNVGLTSRLNRSQLSDYLKNAHLISREQLIKDLKSVGLELDGEGPDGLFKSFSDKFGNIRVKIHPPDASTSYSHVHIYDKLGNSLTSNLIRAPYNSPEVHIEINPIEQELNWRPR